MLYHLCWKVLLLNVPTNDKSSSERETLIWMLFNWTFRPEEYSHLPMLPPLPLSLSLCHSDSLIAPLVFGSLSSISALWNFGSHYPRRIRTLEIGTLWSFRPNLMGHQSPNPPQPAQWISATRIWSHPCPSQRPFRPTHCKCEAAPLGPRPAWVYP